MARTRTAKHPKAEEATPAEQPETISRAEAFRRAVADGMQEADDIIGYVKSRYGMDLPKNQVSAYRAHAKKKIEGAAPVKRGRKPKAAVEGYLAPPPKIEAKGDGDLLDTMEVMKELVASLGVEKVKRIADLLG